MDLDLDDPLGDLLSDGSNDSFFDTKPKKSNQTEKKKNVKDLFNLDNEPKKSEPKKDDWLGLDTRKPLLEKGSPTKSSLKQTKKISFEDDDVTSTLGLGKKDEKKIDLMESILGKKAEDKKFDDNKFDDKIFEKKHENKKQDNKGFIKEDKLDRNFGFSSLDAPREGRRSRSQSTNLDPLGLLSDKSKKPENTNSMEILFPTPKQRLELKEKELKEKELKDRELKEKELKEKELKENPLREFKDKPKSAPNIELPNWLEQSDITKMYQSETAIQNEQKIIKDITDEKHDLIPINSQLDYHSAALTLQQQESQILMALQVKKYDESLSELQRKQQELLHKQEQQFNSLLERQFAKQQIIENNLRLQQEKINNHIQTMLLPFNHSNESFKQSDNECEEKKENEMIKMIKEKSREEAFLLEESYKKQISTLEQTMESIEDRLKSEITRLNTTHQEKYEQLKTDYEEEIKRLKARLENIVDQHDLEIKSLKENHNRIIEGIKEEYAVMIENMKQTKEREMDLFRNSSEYNDKLDLNVKLLSSASKVLVDVKNQFDGDYNLLNRVKEESLKVKEDEVKMMKEALEQSRQSIALERSQLLALVSNLERRIAEQNQSEREQRYALEQATAIFAAKSKALDRESEYNRTLLEREREEIKTLKTSLLAEQEKLILQLTEERLALATERKRQEMQLKMQSYDSQKGKGELEAAIQVAKEAAEMTDRERDALLKEQAEVEGLKRILVDREKKLRSKEMELHEKMREASRRSADGEKALEHARNLERNVNSRLREVQGQLSSLAVREKKLADEKIAMSKERLKLTALQAEVKKCGLCSIGLGKVQEENDENSEVEQDLQFTAGSDPDLLRLRLKYSNNDRFNAEFNST